MRNSTYPNYIVDAPLKTAHNSNRTKSIHVRGFFFTVEKFFN